MPGFAAAWYVHGADAPDPSLPHDISALETKGFNLFFLNDPRYAQWSLNEKNAFVQGAIEELGDHSLVVLSLEPFLDLNWFAPGGMETFLMQWGTHPKVFGFLLRDDLTLAPWPSPGGERTDALWVFRWYYRMIRNRAEDRSNSLGRDLAPGKPILVTLPYEPRRVPLEIGDCSEWSAEMSVNGKYRGDIPPDFFLPGDCWDIVAPYWYPHRRSLGLGDEVTALNAVLRAVREKFSPSATIPILQACAEADGDLEAQYDLSIQYERFRAYGLMTVNKTILYYSANSHYQAIEDLLHNPVSGQKMRDTSDLNVFLREAGKLNAEHMRLFR